MNRVLLLLTILVLSQSSPAKAEEGRGGRDGGQAQSAPSSEGRAAQAPSRPQAAAPAARQPVVINMSRPAPRANNTQHPGVQRVGNAPTSYSHVQWQTNPVSTSPAANQVQPNRQPSQTIRSNPSANQTGTTQAQSRIHYVPATQSFTQRANAANYASPGVRAANVVHHHPYTTGYVRKKLQKLGVKTEPSYITDRSQIIDTDRSHSIIQYPKQGPDHAALTSTVMSVRHFNDPLVRDQMTRVNSQEVLDNINRFNESETRVNHYYWHQQDGFNYCHYIDPYGYHWYGWYVGENYFWTRYYSDRWWWYDTDFGRWCFWNEGNWWWQDPDHMGDLYCYNNDTYVPCNSADDQIVVTAPDTPDVKAYPSSDNSRIVKITGDSQDAFLYDNSQTPAFNPVYLASGVKNVQFSNTDNGRPLEILLTLTDGSFDVYDGDGNAYNPGSFDADQAAQSSTDAQPGDTSDPDPGHLDPPANDGTSPDQDPPTGN